MQRVVWLAILHVHPFCAVDSSPLGRRVSACTIGPLVFFRAGRGCAQPRGGRRTVRSRSCIPAVPLYAVPRERSVSRRAGPAVVLRFANPAKKNDSKILPLAENITPDGILMHYRCCQSSCRRSPMLIVVVRIRAVRPKLDCLLQNLLGALEITGLH